MIEIVRAVRADFSDDYRAVKVPLGLLNLLLAQRHLPMDLPRLCRSGPEGGKTGRAGRTFQSHRYESLISSGAAVARDGLWSFTSS